jgi:glycosyltransferase involved in cell wall biosynthesis
MVSVIIPNYNHDAYLKQRINSVLKQTYKKFEIILLDDNSSDDSKHIIEEYRQNSKVSHIIYNEKNSGSVFKQWEKGITLAKGKYIWIAESDDYADVTFLEKLVPIMESNLSIGLAYCNSVIVNENNEILNLSCAQMRNKSFNTTKWNYSYLNQGVNEIDENLFNNCTINNASAVLVRKSALEDVFPLPYDFRYIGDWYCYLKICTKHKVYYLNENLNYYRWHSSNASKNLYKNQTNIYEYFLLYDWMLKNLNFVDLTKLTNSFTKYIRISLFRGWNRKKIILFKKLFSKNKRLFLSLIIFNLKVPSAKLFPSLGSK